jgi:hypothetical protein
VDAGDEVVADTCTALLRWALEAPTTERFAIIMMYVGNDM